MRKPERKERANGDEETGKNERAIYWETTKIRERGRQSRVKPFHESGPKGLRKSN
jgi:hypothetical protein